MSFIPVCEPLLLGNERKYVNECLRDNWISSHGKFLERFENQFSHYCGQSFGIGVCNGTVALHLAVAALGIGKDDEVIMPSFTIASTAFSVIYAQAKPVFVDVEPKTFNMDPSLIESRITKKTKAIMVVHMYAHPCDMDAIMKIARKHKLYVIEDAAQAHGAMYKGKRCGSFGDVATFSFYSNKIITTGEGGMVVTRNLKIAEACRSLKNLAFSPKQRFWHEAIGFNYRMTNIQAAIGLAQLEKIDTLLAKRRANALLYNQLLEDVPGVVLPVELKHCRNGYWMYVLRLLPAFGMGRDALMAGLRERGIETRTFFIPLHVQPIFKPYMKKVAAKDFPVSEEIAKDGFYLPSSGGLTVKQIIFITQAIKEIRQKSL